MSTGTTNSTTEFNMPLNVTVQKGDSNEEGEQTGDKQQAAELHRVLTGKIRETILNEQRPGGILNR